MNECEIINTTYALGSEIKFLSQLLRNEQYEIIIQLF